MFKAFKVCYKVNIIHLHKSKLIYFVHSSSLLMCFHYKRNPLRFFLISQRLISLLFSIVLLNVLKFIWFSETSKPNIKASITHDSRRLQQNYSLIRFYSEIMSSAKRKIEENFLICDAFKIKWCTGNLSSAHKVKECRIWNWIANRIKRNSLLFINFNMRHLPLATVAWEFNKIVKN